MPLKRKLPKQEVSSCLESSSSSSSSSPRVVGIVTPEVKRARRKERLRRLRASERKKERAIVAHLMRHRHDEECSDWDGEVARNLQAEFDESEEEVEARISFSSKQPWESSLRHENVAGWRVVEESGAENREFGMCFLRSVVGESPKHLDRLRHWSKWGDSSVPLPAITDTAAVWIRTIMKHLCANDYSELKAVIVHGRSVLGDILHVRFGGFKRTLLHAFALHPRCDMLVNLVRQLVATIAAPVDTFGLSPLHLLSLNKSLRNGETVEILARMASLQPEPAAGSLPIHFFVLSDHGKMEDVQFVRALKALKSQKAFAFSEQRDALLLSVSSSRARLAIQSLVEVGFNALSVDAEGYSVLHLACAEGKSELTEFLLTHIPRNLRMRKCRFAGSTPLHAAAVGVTEMHAACISILAREVASSEILANLKDNQGWPPLLYALFTGEIHTVRACLELDSQLHDLTWGETPQLVFALQLVGSGKVDNLLMGLVGVPEFFVSLNKFLKKDIGRLAGPLGFLLDIKGGSKLLTVENKLAFLRYRAHSSTRLLNLPASHSLVVPRVGDSSGNAWLTRVLGSMSEYCCGQSVAVRFTQEDGKTLEPGYGIGPTREFFSIGSDLMVREIFQPNSQNTQLLPSPHPAHASAHRALGRLAALSLLAEGGMDFSQVSPVVWERNVGLDLFASWDPVMAKSLRWILENDVSSEPEIAVLLDGLEKSVFVGKKIRESLAPLQPNLEAFREGFFDVFPKPMIEGFIDPIELAVLFGSTRTEIDVHDWSQNTAYNGFSSGDAVVKWFWELATQLPKEERKLLLLFATGLTAPPLGGFANLKSDGGESMLFTIMKVETADTSALPTAATCFNMIKLPQYSSQSVLNQKVLTAIRFGAQGFSFA